MYSSQYHIYRDEPQLFGYKKKKWICNSQFLSNLIHQTYVHQCRALITRLKQAISPYSGIVWVLFYNIKRFSMKISAKSQNLDWKQQNWRSFWYPGTVNNLEIRSICLRSNFFFIGNIRQFISNSSSSNTKYFYDWPISNSLKTPISNYFLTVRTKKELTLL